MRARLSNTIAVWALTHHDRYHACTMPSASGRRSVTGRPARNIQQEAKKAWYSCLLQQWCSKHKWQSKAVLHCLCRLVLQAISKRFGEYIMPAWFRVAASILRRKCRGKWKGRQSPRIKPKTPGLCNQCFTTEVSNHQPSQFYLSIYICTVVIVQWQSTGCTSLGSIFNFRLKTSNFSLF